MALKGVKQSPEHVARRAASMATTRRIEAHGYAGRKRTPTYNSWSMMKQRCTNPKAARFSYYGGRGITVCERWLNSFGEFLADMGVCPEGCSLDRIDNDGNYEPGNCRWATRSEQNSNRRRPAWYDRGKT